MKQFIERIFLCAITICGILSILLSSCRSEPVQMLSTVQASPTIKDGGVLSGDPCGAPCFWGIIPGVTTKDQVVVILESRKVFQDCEFYDNSQDSGESGINCNCGINIGFQKNMDIVAGLGFIPYQEITIGEIITKYGSPDAVLLTPQGTPDGPPRVSMILYFDKINTSMVLHEQDSNIYEALPTSQVTLIRYHEQSEYESSRKYFSDNWNGYGIYDKYFNP